MNIRISSSIFFSFSHRVENSNSAGEDNLHGHTVRIDAVCSYNNNVEQSEKLFTGGTLNTILIKRVFNVLDHKCVIFRNDKELMNLFFKESYIKEFSPNNPFLKVITSDGFEVVLVNESTTGTNMSKMIFYYLQEEVKLASDGEVALLSVIFSENGIDTYIYTPSY